MAEPNIPRRKSEPSMLDAALHYFKHGWNIIPVNRKKEPLLDKWKQYQQQRVTEENVRKWWGRWPSAGVAVLTGAISGVVVIDVDEEQGWKHLEPYIGFKTLTCETGKGTHLYFRHPGSAVPSLVRFLPGIDCRGDGGYAVVPPSLHKTGKQYRWENPKAEIKSLPPELLKLITKKDKKKLAPKDLEKDLPHGERDVELTRRVGKLLREGYSPKAVLAMAKGINIEFCKPPLSQNQVQKIVQSIAERNAADKPSKKEFKTVTTREMLERYGETEPRWAIDGWLPEASCGLVVSPPGSYKTWVLASLAYAVATGHPFLGNYPVMKKGPVLHIQQEDPFPMLIGRIAAMFNSEEPTEKKAKGDVEYGLDCRFVEEMLSMPVHWHEDRELNLEDKSCMARMGAKIVEIRPALVTIDPLYSGISAKDYMALGAQAMLQLKRLRDEYGCSFAIAHHTTVAGSSSEDRATIWGSQFLNAWLEFGWQIREIGGKNDEVRIVRHFKGSGNPKKLHLKFKITNYSFGVDVSDAPTSVSERIEEAILDGNRPSSVKDIQVLTGCSRAQAFRIAKKMKLENGEEGGDE